MREFVIMIRFGELGGIYVTVVIAYNVTEAVDAAKENMTMKEVKTITEIRAITALDMMLV